MPQAQRLSAGEFLELFETRRDQYGWVDVRSEGEFETASLPGFTNLPILTNPERHEVGLTYKQKGQTQAIEVGHRLVDPHRRERADAWKNVADRSSSREAILICWRGGMRSQIASQWAREAGASISTVEGGIKAIRGELLNALQTIPNVAILAGLTGSGKTELLQDVKTPKIDLERLANHRGSSFGRKIRGKQPSQATFENLVLLELRRNRREESPRVLLEDESTSIGLCFLPRELKQTMNGAPCIWVESSPEERARRIYSEYIQEPLDLGIPSREVFEWMLSSLERIQKKLGGLETTKVHRLMQEAFRLSDEQGFRASFHEEWIVRLLELYYDPMYRYGFEKHASSGRKIIFRGNIQECGQWLEQNHPS